MVSDGDTVTYNYTGSKESVDISNIDTIDFQVEGAGGSDADNGGPGGDPYRITGSIDVSNLSNLELWVGQGGATSDPQQDPSWGGGWGRANGGDGTDAGTSPGTYSGSGGGSTEIVCDSTDIIEAGAGGGAGRDGNREHGGGGGGAGGSGGYGEYVDALNSDYAGEDAEGSGVGGDGGDYYDNYGYDGGTATNSTYVSNVSTTLLNRNGDPASHGEIILTYKVDKYNIYIDGDQVKDITIDGTDVSDVSIDGTFL